MPTLFVSSKWPANPTMRRAALRTGAGASVRCLWERLIQTLPISGRVGWETYGVCAASPGSETGAMGYTAGVALSADAIAPDGLEVIEVAAQNYLVFRQVMDGRAKPRISNSTRPTPRRINRAPRWSGGFPSKASPSSDRHGGQRIG